MKPESISMKRRDFLIGAATAAASRCHPGIAALSPEVSADLTLRDDSSAPLIPHNFTGLSYELAQLTDPTFFSSANRDLIAYFRLLTPNGVLRLGGNTSEFCWFKANATTPAPKLHVPPGNLDANWMPHRLFEIHPEAIDAITGFLRATGWRLIYGLNFGNSSPQRAADEAAYVAGKIGDQLEFFQIGNEPDLYRKASNGTRPPRWDFPDYIREWSAFAHAIATVVPAARFGAPDVAASSDWITRFSAQVPAQLASRVVALTGHYYAEGPPDDPRVTIERLLAGNPRIAAETTQIMTSAHSSGRIYRMTEGNSCYRGGKPGMSDAFAAALWAGDYMLQLASLGCAGVNLHGGRSAFLTAGLGGHTPGMHVATTPQTVHSGFYTPIQSEPGREVKAMPIFYGMMLANQFAGCKMLRTDCDLHGANLTVYAALDDRVTRVALFNKDDRASIDLAIHGLSNATSSTVWRMQAPALNATEDVTLAGARVLPHAHWSPRAEEPVKIRKGVTHLRVPSSSAALLILK
jgi:hypothetical protein